MRSKTNLFQVNGKPLLAPDGGVAVMYADLDAADAGRDEAGVMHRYPVRYQVASWDFTYSFLTEVERKYMEGLFPNSATFSFTHPSRTDSSKSVTTTCYRSQHTVTWQDAKTGLWSNYGFRIIQC